MTPPSNNANAGSKTSSPNSAQNKIQKSSLFRTSKIFKSPKLLSITTILFIFLAELMVMVLLLVLPPLPDWVVILLDALLLVILITPMFYFFMFRPLIDSKKESEEYEGALKEQLGFLQEMINSIPSPIFYKDADGKYLGCNSAYEEYIGMSRDDLIGKDVFDITSKDLAEIYHKRDLELFENPGVQVYEASIQHADKSMHNVVFHRATFLKTDGTLGGLVGAIHDITNLKISEAEREKLNQALSKRLQELNTLYDIQREIDKHESIDSFFLEVTKLIAKGMRYPEKVWARIQFDGKIFLSFEENYNDLFFVTSDIGIFGDIRGCLEVGYSEDIEILDEEITLFHNTTLLIGRVAERLELRDKVIEQERLEVAQQTAGAVAHEINQPLQALVMISELLKRGIDEKDDLIESIPGHVSDISTLVQKMLSITSVETMKYALGKEILNLHKSLDHVKPISKKVLVIDDQEPILDILSRVLSKKGYKVDVAATGEDALNLIEEGKYGLIISDISLPGISGIDIFKEIKKKNISTAFIFMSGYAIDDDKESVISQSAGFLQKPFDFDQIFGLLSKFFPDGGNSDSLN